MFLNVQNKHITNDLFFRIMCFFWLLIKAISWRVWTPHRDFPRIPWIEIPLNDTFHYVLFGLSCLFLVCSVILKIPKKIILFFLFVELLLLVLDQMRWQPWEYQFMLTTLFYLIYSFQNRFKHLLLLLFSATYIYSGLHKFNFGFVESNWGEMILSHVFGIKHWWKNNEALFLIGFGIPILELTLGICLLFFKTRKIAIFGLIVMHLFILLVLSPLGVNFNVVVWPWNALMILFLILLKVDLNQPINWNNDFKKPFVRIVFCILFIFPFSNLFGYWEHYLSFGMYSGKGYRMYMCIDSNTDVEKFQLKQVKYDRFELCPNHRLINMGTWSLNELKVPIYPEKRINKAIENYFERMYPNAQISWHYIPIDYSYKMRKDSL